MNRQKLKADLIASECKVLPSDFGCTSQVISILKELKLEHHGFEKNIDKAINQVLGGLDYL